MDCRGALAVTLAASLEAIACNSNRVAGADSGPADSGSELEDGGPDAGADGGLDGGTLIELGLALHRLPASGAAPDAILAVVTASDGNGRPIGGLDVMVDAGGALFHAAADAGFYLATVIPPFSSGELPLIATASGVDATAQRTALVLPFINERWDQPEPVAGLVNTPGVEDSSTISPDGQWLIVASYSPMDVFCCSLGCGYPVLDGDNPACIDVLGPISGPARPGMPGADRIVGSKLADWSDPQMCAVLPDGGPIPIAFDGGFYPFALPLVAEYGFHRQADGSFAEPFLIDIDSDGFVGAPFCLTFLGTGADSGTVPVIFGYSIDALDGGKPHPWFGTITLGQTNTLGSYACDSPTLPAYPTFTPNGIAPIPVGPPDQQGGNTSVALVATGAYLLSDDESASPPFVEYSLILDAGAFADWAPMALPEPGIDRRQPVLAGDRLFYFRGGDVASVSWSGGDPGTAEAFSDLQTELAREPTLTGRVGEVIGLGQPTFALVDGGVQMIFVYYRRSATGADGQIGSIWLR